MTKNKLIKIVMLFWDVRSAIIFTNFFDELISINNK